MKKIILILAVAAAGTISAYGNEPAVKNWISGEVSLFGAGARYERMLAPKFSIGVDAYQNMVLSFWTDKEGDMTLFWGYELETGLFGRFYPGEGKFFFELGLGYHRHYALKLNLEEYSTEDINGAAVSPGLGWRIDFGKPGGFFITPGVKVPITIGVDMEKAPDEELAVGVGFVAYFGLGGSF
jgi:hypothetical protein